MARQTVAVSKKPSKPTNPTLSLHPPYFQMISEAISTLKERTGSSQQAISKFIVNKHSKFLPLNFKKVLSVQLKKFVKSERLVKVKNSFKLSSTEKLKKNKGSGQVTKKTSDPVKVKENGAKKTKKLSQVKTPEGLKNKAGKKGLVGERKMKRLSQVKTPEGLKKKTPMKRKNLKMGSSSRPQET